jgi:hypothetical protein
MQITRLERVARALIRLELVEQDRVVLSILHVLGEVGHLSVPSSRLQVVVEPSEQDLVWRQAQELLQCLAVVEQAVQLGVDLDVDLGEQSTADDLPNETEDEVFSTLGNVLWTNVDDGTADTLCRGDDDVVVLGHLEGVQWLGLASFDGGFVEHSLVDGVGDRVVDEFTEDQTICA